MKWSPGLKKRFSLDEVADEVPAEEAQDETTKLVTLVEVDDWRHVLWHRAQADVLTAAEDAGSAGVDRLVSGLKGDADLSRTAPMRSDLCPSPRDGHSIRSARGVHEVLRR